MGHVLKSILPIAQTIGSIAATATGNPELVPLIQGGGDLVQGKGIGTSLKDAGLAFAGQQVGGLLGNQFPETLGGTFGTGGNSLSDLLGYTSDAGSLSGAGTIGGDLSNLFSGTSGGESSLSSLTGSAGSKGSDILSNGLQSGSGLSAGTSNAPLYNIGGGGASSFGTPASNGWESALQSAGGSTAASLPSNGWESALQSAGTSLPAASASSPTSFSSLLGKYALPTLGAASSLGSNLAAQQQLKTATNKANAQLSPYLQTGGAASTAAGNYLGLNGEGNNTSASDILAASPGYQFQLDQGNRALAAQQAASGSLNSGAAQKAAQQFGTGLANQTAQQYFSNLQNTAGQGLGAAGQYGNNTTAMGTAGAASNIATGNTLAQLLASGNSKRVTGYNPTTGQPIYG